LLNTDHKPGERVVKEGGNNAVVKKYWATPDAGLGMGGETIALTRKGNKKKGGKSTGQDKNKVGGENVDFTGEQK